MNHHQRVHMVSGFLVFLIVVALAMSGAIAPAQAAPDVLTPDLAPQAIVTVEGTPTVYFATSSSTTSPYTITFDHTTSTTVDRLLLVGVSWNASGNDSPISSITFTPSEGSPAFLSPVIARKNSASYRYAAIYGLVNPPSGLGTVTVTFGNSVGSGIIAGAANLAGVDTTTPLGTPSGADGTGTLLSVTVSGLAGDELVFDTAFLGGTNPTLTVDASQSPQWNATAGNARGGASTEQAFGSSVVMSWTGGASGPWVDLAVPIFPACTGARYTLTAGSMGPGTVALTPAGGSYCSGRSVTLTPTPNSGYLFSGWVGANAADIVNTAGVHTIVMNGDKYVTANFVPQACQDAFPLNVDDDTYLSGATGASTYNYGGATSLQVDRGTDTSRRTALLRWNNLSSIPANATVSSASIVLQVTDNSTYAYPLYEGAKAWVEGTNNGAAGTGASWTYYDAGTTAWTTEGASSITGSIDRGSTNLWSSTTTSFSSAGAGTVSLNAAGLAVVQRWVAGGANNGVIIQDYTSGTNNLIFDSSEGTTPPALNINYCLPNNTAPNQPVLVAPAPSGATGVSTSPTLEVTVSDTDSNRTDVTFYGRAVGAGTWLNLGTVYAVASGANATMSWPGLTASTQYEWYVTVDDGPATTTGSTWTFTTASETICYALTLGHTGNGTTPTASPTNSIGCPSGQYLSGESVSLSGTTPDTGWGIAGWTGTSDDESTANTNSLTMPAEAHSAGVNYLRLLGDVDLDGDVTSADALIVLSADADIDTLTYCPMNYGDVNGDGAVNSTDALIILTYDAELPVGSLPVGQPVAEPVVPSQPLGCTAGSGALSKLFQMLVQ